MDANLHLDMYRLHEAELVRDLELRRRAAERAGRPPVDGRRSRRALRRPALRRLGFTRARRTASDAASAPHRPA
jgi:hypothetical protein